MDLLLTHRWDEAAMRRRWRRVYYILHAPLYVCAALVIVFLLVEMWETSFEIVLGCIAVLIAFFSLIRFPRIWKIYREVFRKSGAFEHPTTIHLTDTFAEVTCGDNFAKNEYRVFSEYLKGKDFIALISQHSIAAIFSKNEFPDGGEEFVKCLEKAGVKKVKLWHFKRWWAALLLLVALLCCIGPACCGGDKPYQFRPTTAAQMRKHLPGREAMLMIPVVIPDFPEASFVLDTPVEICYPFDDLPMLTGYQYVVWGYDWSVGSKGLLVGFLVIDSEGRLFAMETPQAPFDGDRDIFFYKAKVSPAWKAALTEGIGGIEIPWEDWDDASFRWRDPDAARPILRRFLDEHPLEVEAETGRWDNITKPCFTPNVYCERDLHPMPRFAEREILLLRLNRVWDEKYHYFNTELLFPDGRSMTSIDDMNRKLGKEWATGKYRIVAYDRTSEPEIDDPERRGWAAEMRTWAADRGVPLVILYGEDKTAPEYPGLPKGIKQYWQCPQCAADQLK